MVSALGGGASKADAGRAAWALAPTVTYANGMPRTAVNSWEMRVVMTTWTQEYLPVPRHASGTGEPGRFTGGELMVTLLMNPLVALHEGPAASNQVALNAVPDETSQPFE